MLNDRSDHRNRLWHLVILGLLGANLLVTFILVTISMKNYPGGEALARLNQMYSQQQRGALPL